MNKTKICIKCKEEKSIDLFCKDKRMNDGVRGVCKDCLSVRQKLYRQNRTREQLDILNEKRRIWYNNQPPEKIEEINKKHRIESLSDIELIKRREYDRNNSVKHKERIIFYNAKQRAKECGLEFDITVDDIIIPEICPVLGIPIIRDYHPNKNGKGGACDNSPSIDRIDNSKGYIKGNVRIISYRANNIKSSGTADEHRKIADYIDSCMTHQNDA